MESVEVAEDAATTASRNTSPSLPEDAHLFEPNTVSKTAVGGVLETGDTAAETRTGSLSCQEQATLTGSVELKGTVCEKTAPFGPANEGPTISTDSGILDECVEEETPAQNDRMDSVVSPVVQDEPESSGMDSSESAVKDEEHVKTSTETSTQDERSEKSVIQVQDETESSMAGSEGAGTTTKDGEHVETSNKESDNYTNGENGCEEMETGDDNMCDDIETPTKAGGLITSDMISEEQRLKERTSRESSAEGRQVQELSNMVEHQRFMRLQHLLERSTVYSRFLVKRMEGELEKEKKQQQETKTTTKQTTESESSGENTQKKESIGSELDSPVAGRRVTRSGASLNSPITSLSVETMDTGSTKKKKGRGRKRKAEIKSPGSFKISDFMDSQGKLKRRKLDSGEASTSRNDQKKQPVEEETKERYYEGQLIPSRQPKLLTGGIMRSYQLDGMEWVKTLYENGVNGILADEMGLGKTIQCISVIAGMIEKGVKGPFLVAAPLSTVPNWVAEFNKFTPTIPVVLYHGNAAERLQLRRKIFGSSSNLKKKPTKLNKSLSEELQPVVVTSYEICMRDQDYLQHRSWKFLVVDEGHRIKNLNCKLIKTLKAYDAGNRLLLTGTPLQNNLSELWALLNFLLPDIFDDLNSFQSWFDFNCEGEDEVRERIIEQEREQHVLKTLHQILTPFLLRRLKTDVEYSLPPKKEILIYAPLTSHQERYYKSLLDRTIFKMMEEEKKKKNLRDGGTEGKENIDDEKTECQDGEKNKRKRKSKSPGYTQLSDEQFDSIMKGEADLEDYVHTPKEEVKQVEKVATSVTNIKMTSVFMMLRKCCNHPYLLEFPLTPDGQFKVDEDLVNCCGKILVLDRLLPALIKDGHKSLIFSQFTSVLDILEDYLEMRNISYGRLDGSMAFSERQRQMTVFRENPDCMVFLLSTRAGGLGINLTSADTVIIYDSDWNPQSDLQAQDRCHRIGQTNPVIVYRLVTANTIDQRIVERAASKRRLEKMVIHKGKFKGSITDSDMSLDDLVDLLQSVDHDKVVNSKDAVISDEALSALLNRNLSNDIDDGLDGKEERGLEESAGERQKHLEVFKVIEERDSSGNVRNRMQAEQTGTTMDSLHITTTTESQ